MERGDFECVVNPSCHETNSIVDKIWASEVVYYRLYCFVTTCYIGRDISISQPIPQLDNAF